MMKKLNIYILIVVFLGVIVISGLYISRRYVEDEKIVEESYAESSISEDYGSEDSDFQPETNISDGKSLIYYYVEASVEENILFTQFLNNEVKAFDFIEDTNEYSKFDYYGKEFYIKDLYMDYWENNASDTNKGIEGIHIMSRDMNGDDKSELLILIEYHKDEADLHVFEERDGKLCTWEYWRNLRTMRSSIIEIYDTGIICRGGSGNESYTKYNADGKIENILMYSYQRESTESGVEGEFVYYYELTIYDNENIITRLEYQEYNNRLTDEITITSDNQKIKEQCVEIFEQIKNECGEAEIIDKVQSLDGVKEITLSELME